MIIDVNTYLGHWPFRNIRNNTAEQLSEIAEKNGITHMLVSSLNALFYKDNMRGNLELKNEIEGFSGKTKFLPLAVINPVYTMWEKDMKTCIEDYGFVGIELFPVYHGYPLAPFPKGYAMISPAADACRLAHALNGVVRISAGFENCRQRHRMDVNTPPLDNELCSLLDACPDTTFILNGFMPDAMSRDFREIVLGRKNIFFDTTALESFIARRFEKTAEIFGDERICFGSLAPLQYPAVNRVKVEFVEGIDKERILFGNMKNVLI